MRLPFRIIVSLVATVAASSAAHAVGPRRTLDAYALFATDALRVAKTTVRSGDLGVNDGLLAAGRGLRAPASLLVARQLRIGRDAACAGRFGDGREAGRRCPSAGPAPSPLVAAVGERCGLPQPFPACDPTRDIEVTDGATRQLGGGVYGRAVVRKGSLDLAGGHYVFCELEVGRRGAVRVEAPVEVDVVRGVALGGRAVLEPAAEVVLSPDDVRLRLGGGRLRAGPRARLVASVCAPGADVALDRCTLEGRAVGRRVRATGVTVAAPWADEREPCDARNPLRTAYFGDLHVHTQLSFDVRIFGASPTLDDAYRFARGEPMLVAPHDASGRPTRTVRLDRPLDFAAVTDHSEFLGEVETCSVPGLPGYDSQACQDYRGRGFTATVALGATLYFGTRDAATCGPEGAGCLGVASSVWQRVQQAAEAAYDRSRRCGFTSLVGYEYTAVAPSVSTLHRNVLFRTERVPALPTSYFEARNRGELWRLLREQCVRGGDGCDVLAIPHNANESNGRAFLAEYPGAAGAEEERALAALGGSMEPLLEIFQHKGDSECMNGLSGIVGAADELCDFEKRLRAPDDCGDGVGSFGAQDAGCLSRRDFARGALLEGLRERERLGANPFRLGFVASTDTHNGTSGYVAEDAYVGHQGDDEATTEGRLGDGTDVAGLVNDPGGLAGVWAEENSRGAIFDALRRRETFGTSGPRIAVRLFAGYGLPSGSCGDPDMVRTAYARGVAMGGVLGAPPPAGPAAPSILVAALRDPGTAERSGAPLERLQIVKGWLAGGEAHVQVYDVAGGVDPAAVVDPATCTASGRGADQLCAVWTDPAFDPAQHAWYYARVLENPTCRWSAWECLRLPVGARPPSCDDPSVPRTVQERAWTSPVWYEPEGS